MSGEKETLYPCLKKDRSSTQGTTGFGESVPFNESSVCGISSHLRGKKVTKNGQCVFIKGKSCLTRLIAFMINYLYF